VKEHVMYRDSKLRRLQKELCHSSLNNKEDIKEEVIEDLEVEDEVKSPVITLDSLYILPRTINNL